MMCSSLPHALWALVSRWRRARARPRRPAAGALRVSSSRVRKPYCGGGRIRKDGSREITVSRCDRLSKGVIEC
jgi:hypothetical protein